MNDYDTALLYKQRFDDLQDKIDNLRANLAEVERKQQRVLHAGYKLLGCSCFLLGLIDELPCSHHAKAN